MRGETEGSEKERSWPPTPDYQVWLLGFVSLPPFSTTQELELQWKIFSCKYLGVGTNDHSSFSHYQNYVSLLINIRDS